MNYRATYLLIIFLFFVPGLIALPSTHATILQMVIQRISYGIIPIILLVSFLKRDTGIYSSLALGKEVVPKYPLIKKKRIYIHQIAIRLSFCLYWAFGERLCYPQLEIR